MGTLLLGRQIGGAVALAAAQTIYGARLDAGASAAVSTGTGVFIVSLAGAALAAFAVVSLPRAADAHPGRAAGRDYCSPIARLMRSSGLIRWLWSSRPSSISTQLTSPVNVRWRSSRW